MKNKIILLTVNSKKKLYSITADEFSAIQPNIVMGLLASYLKSKNIFVDTLDETYNLSIEDTINIIDKEKPILVGVICSGANPSSSTMSMVGAIEFFKEFNKCGSESKTFIAGGHPSVLPERTLRETNCDYVILGEGYYTLVDLYEALINKDKIDNIKGLAYFNENEFVNTGFSELIDVNELPSVDWDIMNPIKYRAHNWHCFENINNRSPYGVIWTSFGCPHNCSFCCINNVFGKRTYRLRDINSVIREIDYLVQKYNVKNIKIQDELFIIKHPRIYKFCEELEKRKYDLNMWAYARMDSVDEDLLYRLRKVGMKWIAYGIESSNENILKDINKGYNIELQEKIIKITQKEEIYICADMIAGLWLDNLDTLENTYEFTKKHNFEWMNIYPAFAYPGTSLYNNLLKEKIISEPKSWETYALYGYNCIPLPTKYMSSAEVLRWRDTKFLEYHQRLDYLKMINKKFGLKTRNHIMKLTSKSLKRRILEND